jgi:hypothetical protein
MLVCRRGDVGVAGHVELAVGGRFAGAAFARDGDGFPVSSGAPTAAAMASP